MILLAIPLLALVSALFLYRHNGKREFLKFDVVQFIYSFIITPILFLWLKSFLFFILRSELDLHLSVNDLFVFDSIFSLGFLYVYAFIVIHSLTKSFKMKMLQDPLYDLFHHSEYFHLWLSHVIMFGGALTLITLFSVINSVMPLPLVANKLQFYSLLLAGLFGGVGNFLVVWLSNPQQGNFMRIMKLLFAACFFIQVLVYFLLDPPFTAPHVFYWMTLLMSTVLVVLSLFFHRSRKAVSFANKLKDYKWGLNIELFK